MFSGANLDDASTYDSPGTFLPPLGEFSVGSLITIDSVSMADTIDTRKFKKGAKIFMRGGLAVEKTLLNVFKTKTSNESRDNDSLASDSIGALSIGPGFYRTPQFNSLSNEEKMVVNCWNAFKAYSVQQGDKPVDGGSKGVPIGSLVAALRAMSKSLTPTELTEIVHNRQYPSNAMLSFKEFQQLAASVFPSPQRSSAQSAPSSAWNMRQTHQDLRDPNAYNRLQQKHRGASSIVFSALPPTATTDMGVCESVTVIDGVKVATAAVNGAMLTVFKNEARRKKMQIKNALQTGDPVQVEAAQSALRNSLSEPLLKHKVYGLTHGKETYAAKWERMKAKRDDRIEREIKHAARGDMVESMSRLVLKSEKRVIREVVEAQEDAAREAARLRVLSKIAEEKEAAERIFRQDQEALDKRKQSAAVLREALDEASILTQSMHEEELAEKKEAIVPFQLNPASSALVTVPDEITIKVKRAKTLESYNSAKQAEKDYWEQTLDNRIKRFAYAKYEKMFKAADVGVRVAVTPLHSGAGRHKHISRAYSPMRDSLTGDGCPVSPTGLEDAYLQSFAMSEYLHHKSARANDGDDDSVNTRTNTATNSPE